MPLLYLAVCVTGEAGELANEVKKVFRGDHSLGCALDALEAEIADVLIYALKLATQLGLDAESILERRLERNKKRFRGRGRGTTGPRS